MKNQIEFHFILTEDPFIIDPANIRLVYKHLSGCIITTAWQGEIEVCESYDTVKRMLSDYHYPHANDIAPDYVPCTHTRTQELSSGITCLDCGKDWER